MKKIRKKVDLADFELESEREDRFRQTLQLASQRPDIAADVMMKQKDKLSTMNDERSRQRLSVAFIDDGSVVVRLSEKVMARLEHALDNGEFDRLIRAIKGLGRGDRKSPGKTRIAKKRASKKTPKRSRK